MNCSLLPGQIHPWLQAAPASRNWQVGWDGRGEMRKRDDGAALFCGALLFNGIPDSSRDIRPAGLGRGADNASAAIRLRL